MVETIKPETPQTRTAGVGATTTEDLQHQVSLLKADISKLTESLGDYGRNKSREVQDEARRRATDIRNDAQTKYDDVEAYVRQNPAQALGIAAGIGLLIGMWRR